MSDSTFLPIGTLLSRQYKILQHIGAGGFGKTYLVEDQLGEKKVVKEFFISSMCTRDVTTQFVTVSVAENKQSFQEQLGKFKEEARRLYLLSHPNIVKVSALFDENYTAYYVMTYIEGESLAQKCRKGKLPESQIMRYLDQLLSALDYIHSRGLTHLDIKPGNIMIDHNDNVVLIDFGASKLFNAQSVNKTMMTSMRPPFTPGYAPIEQENGNVKDMGPHCDIYALGATLYYLYTGEKAPSSFEIFQNGLPPIPQASPSMQKVIKGAMEFDVKQRIKNVAEFRAKLREEVQVAKSFIDSEEVNKESSQTTKIDTSKTSIVQTYSSIEQNTEAIKQPSASYEKIEITNISTPHKETPKTQGTKEKRPSEPSDTTKRSSMSVGSKFVILLSVISLVVGLVILSKDTAGIEESNIDGISIETSSEVLAKDAVGAEESKTDEETPSEKLPKDNFVEKVNGVSFEMVYVEGGTFKMGSNDSEAEYDESPVHNVTLSDYCIGETEVTQELWEAVMGTTVAQQRDKADHGWPLCGVGSNYPMYYISWDDCQEFIDKLNQLTGKNFRLPTEAEWEYAARGGNKSRGYKFSGSNTIDDVAWYRDNACDVGDSSPDYGTHPVGTKSPNELGLHDVSGNVLEWCSDWSGDYSSSSQTNPTGPTSGSYLVYRGGSWNGPARYCRVSARSYCTPDHRYYHIGFRLVMPIG